MKTFTPMSTPDKLLTFQAYEFLLGFYSKMSETPATLTNKETEDLMKQTYRLKQLMEALKVELSAE
jgi:hypothetical protein